MPDITMCKGSIGAYVCKKKDNCYRHTAEPTPRWQSYFLTPPFSKQTGDCVYYWPNEEVEKDDREEEVN